MIIRRSSEVNEIDLEKALNLHNVKTTVKWMVDRNVGDESYGHRFALRYFVMEPGGSYPMHKHYYVEAVFLISGKMAFASQDKKWIEILPGDVVYTARQEPHALKNTGNEPAKFVCCIDCDSEGEPCEPIFGPGC